MKNIHPYKAGTKFGRLTVLDFELASYGKGRTKFRKYRCVCECGTETRVASGDLNRGHIVSCGCQNREKAADRWRKYPGNPSLNLNLGGYQRSAAKRGLAWELTREFALDLFTQRCFYCGTEPDREISIKGGGHPVLVNGIDRIDSSLGYISTNCVPCCSTCNFAKRDLTFEQWTRWLDRLTAFRRAPP